ncbi:MAG: hypothetical protein SangKO_005750 [Sandaracinaceae bacterium]
MLAGCSNPDVLGTGGFESPCQRDSDCGAHLRCLSHDGYAFCMERCHLGCRSSYVCDRALDVCVPRPAGDCRGEHARCGDGFDRCCSGLTCAEIDGWGRVCAEEGCLGGEDCWSGCCALVDGTTLCVPPLFCS